MIFHVLIWIKDRHHQHLINYSHFFNLTQIGSNRTNSKSDSYLDIVRFPSSPLQCWQKDHIFLQRSQATTSLLTKFSFINGIHLLSSDWCSLLLFWAHVSSSMRRPYPGYVSLSSSTLKVLLLIVNFFLSIWTFILQHCSYRGYYHLFLHRLNSHSINVHLTSRERDSS